jgi:para-aminobenzoate synthetase component 1
MPLSCAGDSADALLGNVFRRNSAVIRLPGPMQCSDERSAESNRARIIRPMPGSVRTHRVAEPVELFHRPADLLRAWPAGRPLAALVSAGDGRFSILAAPSQTIRLQHGSNPIAPFRDMQPSAVPLDAAPFVGGWICSLSYDAGRLLEPRATHGYAARDRDWPVVTCHRCDGAYIHDAATETWLVVGDPHALPHPDELAAASEPTDEPPILGEPVTIDADTFKHSVARAVELIRAGDVFQVNLSHRMSTHFQGNPRALAAALLGSLQPSHGGYLEDTHDTGALRSAICSLSPELLLDYHPATRRLTTRPIKGTRPASAAHADLLHSEKDAAELAMIVDLMRNDLGRVCSFGSIRVADPRSVEHHGGRDAGVIHAVATVEGTLRPGRTFADALAACFPAGSITGAPKIRAMQIIDELEPVRRGPYCGSLGYISDCGRACFNVAIRTASLIAEPGSTTAHVRGTLDYHVGAGIVADSTPEAEWRETLDKAAGFRRAIRTLAASEARA